jgi:hypothetical protein
MHFKKPSRILEIENTQLNKYEENKMGRVNLSMRLKFIPLARFTFTT